MNTLGNMRGQSRLRMEKLEGRKLMAADIGGLADAVNSHRVSSMNDTAAQISTPQTAGTVNSGEQVNAVQILSETVTNRMAEVYTSNGYLYIAGTDEAGGRDNVFVREQGGNEIEVRVQKWNNNHELLGSYTATFPRYMMPRGIRYYGHAGDDLFSNSTNLPSFASGGDGRDALFGGSAYDSFYGGAGDDVVSGGGGGNFLNGGHGDDLVSGGSGNDTMYGGLGNDRMYGSSGRDSMYGGNGEDYMDGGNGDDYMDGGTDDDDMVGGRGSDTMLGGLGNDKMSGDNASFYLDRSGGGNDRMFGGAGNDNLRGNSGNDLLDGGDGNDRLAGGRDHDRLLGRDGRDTLFGGYGNDYLDGGYDLYADALHSGGGFDTMVRHRSVFGSPIGRDWLSDVTSIDRVQTDWHW